MRKGDNEDDLLDKVVQFEHESLSGGQVSSDFLVVARRFIYFSSRSKQERGNGGKLFLFFSIVVSLVNLLIFIVSPKLKRVAVAPASHRRYYGGELVSKHADALKRSGYVDNILEVGAVGGYSNLLAARNISLAVRLLARLLIGSKRLQQSLDYTCLKDNFRKVGFDLSSEDLSLLQRDCILFEKYKKVYRLLYSWRTPSRLLCVAYYADVEILAQISVCEEIGVPVVDYQHGIQNDGHFMYVRWQHFADKPNCLPGSFFVWDEIAERRINNSLGSKAEVTLVGNFWMSYIAHSNLKKGAIEGYILVALQAWPDFFPEFLWGCLDRHRDLKWVFREHPNFLLMDYQKKEILDNHPNVIFESIHRPIESSLASAILCVTGFSTVALDAKYLGRKSVFTHPKAKIHLSSYIDNETIFYAGSVEEFDKLLDKIIG